MHVLRLKDDEKFVNASKLNDVKMLEQLLRQASPPSVNLRNPKGGFSPIHYAAMHNRSEVYSCNVVQQK